MTRGAGRVLFLVAAAFVLSGASGLVYQVLWQRLLALSFGVTTYATATVLASFMAGLALGGFLGGRLADRSQRPLFWYGVVEIVVGLTAALTPSAFVGLQSAYAAAHAAIGPDLAPIARITAAFLILIVPTAAMGASFPLVVKAGLGAGSIGTRAISLLYATNTLGAVAGALLAGFVLIGTLGVSASIWIAAAVSAGVGIAACVFGRSPMAPTVVAARGQGSDRSDSADDRLRRVLPLLLFISGLCSIAYEVVWTRLLVLFLETTTFAFTVMLATFLMGITAGSFAVTPFIRGVGNAARALAWLQGLVAVASLASLFLFARIDALAALLRGDSASGLAAMATLSFVALFPPALLLGMSFPIAVAAYAGQRGDSGRGVGALYATNVAGAIVGALGAGFVLIPLIGIQRSLVVLAALNWIAAAIAALADRRDGWRGRLSTLVPTLVLTLGLALATPSAFKSLVAGRFPGERLVWLDEGLETTVTITRDSSRNLAMYLNHHHQANTADWMVFFHRMLGHLPMLLHPNPREVLVIGLGGGATPGATIRYEGVRTTVVELAPGVIRGAAQFRDVNYAVVENPNVRIIVDDGRNFLLVGRGGKEKFDVITADAIWPTHAGATNLYSLEYYQLARQSLAPGGIMVQWINRALPEDERRLLLRTFARAFPHVSLWFDGSLVAGSEQPIDPTLPWLEKKLAWPITKASLEQVNLRTPEQIRALYVTDRAGILAQVGDGPLLSDDLPRLEYSLGLTANSGPRRP